MMNERRMRILARLAVPAGKELQTRQLCEAAAEVVGLTGAGIMLMSGDMPVGSACTTNEVSALVERLQYDMGEGPCIDAYQHNRPVLEPNLAAPATPRWLAFTPPAVDAGVRAIFGFPLRVGGVHLGALNLYRDEIGALTDEQHADALVMADLAAQALLVMQAHAPPDQLAIELEEGGDFPYVVHQASGMVAAQLDVGVGQALIRLRAYAFANKRTVPDVAKAVVARTLRFDDLDDSSPGQSDV